MVKASNGAYLACRHCQQPVTVTASKDMSPVTAGDQHLDRAVHTATGLEACEDGRHVAAPIDGPKPTPAGLGIDVGALEWEPSGVSPRSLEVAFPADPAGRWKRGDWVFMRISRDPEKRVLVFDRNEWDCFLDGARNGEFDDIAEPSRT
jgi:hypothetical protein